MNQRITQRCACLLALVCLTSCSSLTQTFRDDDEDIKTYVLALESFSSPQSNPHGAILSVALPQISAGLNSQRIAYRQDLLRLDYYALHEWAEQPSQMIQSLLVQALENSGLFHAVVTEESGARANLRLDTEVIALLHDYTNKEHSEGLVQIRIQYVDLTNFRVLNTKTLKVTQPATSNTPYGGVKAINAALVTLLGELIAFTKNKISRDSPSYFE